MLDPSKMQPIPPVKNLRCEDYSRKFRKEDKNCVESFIIQGTNQKLDQEPLTFSGKDKKMKVNLKGYLVESEHDMFPIKLMDL